MRLNMVRRGGASSRRIERSFEVAPAKGKSFFFFPFSTSLNRLTHKTYFLYFYLYFSRWIFSSPRYALCGVVVVSL